MFDTIKKEYIVLHKLTKLLNAMIHLKEGFCASLDMFDT
jgi:hypothetical protein